MLELRLRKRVRGFQLDLALAAGDEVAVLFGPSGAGKSLTLACVAGVVPADGGRIVVDGAVLYDSAAGVNLPPQARRVGYVPQQYALFPHLDVRHNIGFGMRGSRPERERRLDALTEMMGLEGLERSRPGELSGGQQQRVALARALATEPRVLLLDEPFSAVDAPLRASLRQQLLQVQRRWRITVLLVTHDLDEAFTLGQQVVVLDAGRVLQAGPAAEVFDRPASRRVAALVGIRNVLPARVVQADEEHLHLDWAGREIRAYPQALPTGTPVTLCVRATKVMVLREDRPQDPGPSDNLFWGTIADLAVHSEQYTLYVQLEGSEAGYDLEVDLPGYVYHRLGLAPQQRVGLNLKAANLQVIPWSAG